MAVTSPDVMDTLLILPAGAADLPEVRDLLVETWHATYDSILGPEQVTAITDDWHSLPALARGLDRPGHRFLVAGLGSGPTVLGTASATRAGPERLRLDRLYVR